MTPTYNDIEDFRLSLGHCRTEIGTEAALAYIALAERMLASGCLSSVKIRKATKEAYEGDLQRAEAFLTEKCCDCMGPTTDEYPWRCKACYEKLIAELRTKWPTSFRQRKPI